MDQRNSGGANEDGDGHEDERPLYGVADGHVVAVGFLTVVGVRERDHGQDARRDDEYRPQRGQNPSYGKHSSGHHVVAWLVLIPLLLSLTALPLTLGAVAVRPSQTTIRVATATLATFAVAVILVIVVGAIA